jgi:hypothetical protein
MDTIPIVPTKEEFFSLDDIEFGVKRLTNGKDKDIEGYQVKLLKSEGQSLSLTYTSSSI